HYSVQPNNQPPVAPSPVQSNGRSHTPLGRVQHSPPRAFELAEMPGLVEQYRTAAQNALAAGFDGVEVHAANGYLLDQFLRDSSNLRRDAYGGSPENRCRLLFEVVEAVAGIWGVERMGVRLSPTSPSNYRLSDSDPAALVAVALQGLSRLGVAF